MKDNSNRNDEYVIVDGMKVYLKCIPGTKEYDYDNRVGVWYIFPVIAYVFTIISFLTALNEGIVMKSIFFGVISTQILISIAVSLIINRR